MDKILSLFRKSFYQTIIIIEFVIIIYLCLKLSTISDETIQTKSDKVKYIYSNDYAKSVHQWRDEIYRIGMKHRSSKFYEHDYQNMYGLYLGMYLLQNRILFE